MSGMSICFFHHSTPHRSRNLLCRDNAAHPTKLVLNGCSEASASWPAAGQVKGRTWTEHRRSWKIIEDGTVEGCSGLRVWMK